MKEMQRSVKGDEILVTRILLFAGNISAVGRVFLVEHYNLQMKVGTQRPNQLFTWGLCNELTPSSLCPVRSLSELIIYPCSCTARPAGPGRTKDGSRSTVLPGAKKILRINLNPPCAALLGTPLFCVRRLSYFNEFPELRDACLLDLLWYS